MFCRHDVEWAVRVLLREDSHQHERRCQDGDDVYQSVRRCDAAVHRIVLLRRVDMGTRVGHIHGPSCRYTIYTVMILHNIIDFYNLNISHEIIYFQL